MSSPISPSYQSLQKDKKYFIHTGDLVIMVENVLYRVHRYFFERESVYFKTLFETPSPENEPKPGSSESSALILEEVKASQFSRFLWVFYNPKFSIYDEGTVDDWKSILELSNRWSFPEVKDLAVRELQKKPLSPVERIELYHRNFVDRNLLINDYIELCQRESPLTLKEGLDLGLETTLTIARTREEIRSPRSPQGVMTPLTPTVQGPELIAFIGKSFAALEDDDVTSNVTSIEQRFKSPTITLNGIPYPNGGGKTSQNGNGEAAKSPGGSPPKSQTNKQKETTQQVALGNQNDQKGKNPMENNQKRNGAKEANTTNITPQTNIKAEETKEGESSGDSGTQGPVAGQQGAASGEDESNQEDKKGERLGDKPGATNQSAEAGSTSNALDAENKSTDNTSANGTTHTNGEVETTVTPTTTTAPAVGANGSGDDNSKQQTPVVGNNGEGGSTAQNPLPPTAVSSS